MSSGTSAFGGTGQCYRFWLGFSECRKNVSDPSLCVLEYSDYLECLHREKLKRRIVRKAMEAKKVVAAEQGAPAPAATAGHH